MAGNLLGVLPDDIACVSLPILLTLPLSLIGNAVVGLISAPMVYRRIDAAPIRIRSFFASG